MQQEKSFDTGELTLNYFVGPQARRPLVLLHGLTGLWQTWYSVIPKLTPKWRVYAPDLRGHGKSGRAPDDAYHNADYARDVIAFLRHVGRPVVLVGHSLGAMTAIVTASQYPEGVRALVLLDPPLFTYTGQTALHDGSTQWFIWVAETMRDNPSYETVLEKTRQRLPPDSDDATLHGVADIISKVAPGTVETALRDEIWQGVDLPQALQAISCPTLLIHGDWDRGAAMRAEDVAFFHANCPSAVVVRLPEADHGLRLQEEPDLVLQHVNDFLKTNL